MMDVEATMATFHHGADAGQSQPVIAVCPVCGVSRTTRMRNADCMCRACANTHRPPPIHSRIYIKTFEQRAAQVIA